MLPLSHTYVSAKLIKREDPLVIFGSMLPDITNLSDKIDRLKVHDQPHQFYKFVESDFPNLVGLALGVKLHSPIDRGADYYSDDEKVGFAKIEGRKIAGAAGKLWKVTDSHESLMLAHNFIEAGVDLNLVEFHSWTLALYRKCLSEVDLKKVAECLSLYLQLDVDLILSELRAFTIYLSPDHLSSPESLLKNLIIPWRETLYGVTADFDSALSVLNRARGITRTSYQVFLDNAVRKMRRDFVDYL